VTGRWGRRCRKPLDDLKERRRYSHLKEEALDRIMWRACFGRSFGPVMRQTTKWMNNRWHFMTESITRSFTLCQLPELINIYIYHHIFLFTVCTVGIIFYLSICDGLVIFQHYYYDSWIWLLCQNILDHKQIFSEKCTLLVLVSYYNGVKGSNVL
jgi:hypothetical protein